MKIKLMHEADGKGIFAVILGTDAEAMGCLKAFAEKERIGGAQVTAIGCAAVLYSPMLLPEPTVTKSFGAIPARQKRARPVMS